MQIKTITTKDGVNEINFSNNDRNAATRFYWFRNLGSSVLYISAKPNPIIGADDVAELPANGAVVIETDEGIVYILGAGKVEIHRTDSKICPFRFASFGSGGSDIQNPEIIAYSLQEAGYEVTDDPSTWGEVTRAKWMAYDYRVDYSGVMFIYGGRTVTRNSDKLAYCAWAHFNTDWFIPMAISAYPEALNISMGGITEPVSTIDVDGQPLYWWACGTNSFRGVGDESGYNRRYLGIWEGVPDILKLYNEIKMLGYSLYE